LVAHVRVVPIENVSSDEQLALGELLSDTASILALLLLEFALELGCALAIFDIAFDGVVPILPGLLRHGHLRDLVSESLERVSELSHALRSMSCVSGFLGGSHGVGLRLAIDEDRSGLSRLVPVL
jgi:hypothetical protein